MCEEPESEPEPGPSRPNTEKANRGRWRPYNRRGGHSRGPLPEKSVSIFLETIKNQPEPVPDNISYEQRSDRNQKLVSHSLDGSSTNISSIWKLYFLFEEFDVNSRTGQHIKAFKIHVKNNPELYDLIKISQDFWFSVNLKILQSDQSFKSQWPLFASNLNEEPEATLNVMGYTIHNLMYADNPSVVGKISLKMVYPRLEYYEPTSTLHSLSVSDYGKMIAIRGTIMRACTSEIQCTWMAFRCVICQTEQSIKLIDGIMATPSGCTNGCRNRSKFQPLLESIFTKTIAHQMVRLQEAMQLESGGRVPRTIDVELTADTVDTVCPGDDVTITGILNARPVDESAERRGLASLYKMLLKCVSIVSNRNILTTKRFELNEKDLAEIERIRQTPNPFRLLVQSLCYNIFGHEMIKAGMLLGLLGGNGTSIGKRNEIHVLVVGDPGVGKSQMLQACANVSPRGVFVCGNSTSQAGLTVTVRREKGQSGALEAGALVLADQGTCCIDEFDKITYNRQALLEVMEQQTVSVAKAGVICSLPARTTIIAAANPRDGHYNKKKTVSENLHMCPALLSRFDLVFILLDKPDARLDSLLAAHIQKLHAKPSTQTRDFRFFNLSMLDEYKSFGTATETDPLFNRLRPQPNEEIEYVPHSMLQKYISYARKNVHPKLTPEAADILQKFYLELRRTQTGIEAIPVTTRQLEALIRLSQARARADLCSSVTGKHVNEIIEITKFSMVDVLSTETGTLQMKRNVNGSGLSQASQAKRMIAILQKRSIAQNKTIFSKDELKEMAKQAEIHCDLIQLIESLNIQGVLLKKGTDLYKYLKE